MRKYKTSKRGLTFSITPDEQYYPGSHYVYEVRRNCIIIRPSEEGMTVSRKKCGVKEKALFDIRQKDDFDKMESEGLAESDRGKQSVTYYLTEKGFQWLEKECSMVIHAKNRPEKKYHLNKYDEEQIIEIWAWLKKKEIYTSEFPEELDVAIWLDTDAMESFFEYFGNEENPVPARIYQNAILVLFSDVLDFKVTGMQIWSFRPHGMREEW